MRAQFLVPLLLATVAPTGGPARHFDPSFLNLSAGSFVTSASVSISLKSLPNGETAAVVDMENLRVTRADRNVATKPHSNFNLRFPSEGLVRGLKRPGAGGRQAQRQAADSSGGRLRADSTRRARPDSTRRIRSDSAKRVRPDSTE